ncbi:DNA-directed RNA polymerase sigma-70 factor [Adhaeribacter aerolatus]|uniref:DNA-directed RNA polymerase sigma-70 factor n=1 Tax=Adhaeribacter aerolatus TaxID=670289 RepID=A0A512B2F5_9BACT|nr:RNA polymerase sigma-70 factor [Adhaeribacter aerolatus]GEO06120.1 DNA-directed RNA polymerase sigma-70 factor [Adhaeribacter aerolatus]
MAVNLKNFTDEQLLVFLKENNEFAFDEIYNRYWATLFSQAYKRLANKENTEELLQDLFTKLWINRHQITVTSSLGAYLAVSVKYLVLNQVAKEAVRTRFAVAQKQALVAHTNLTEETIISQELEGLVAQEVAKLAPKCKSVFVLSRFNQYSNKEIAQELNISEKTVENQITKAIKLLRTGLKESLTSVIILLSSLV